MMKFLQYEQLKYHDWRNPKPVYPFGISVYCADAQQGKTISAIEYLERCREKYEGVKIYTNIEYDGQDGRVFTIEHVIKTPNNSIIFLDEINLILNSHNWHNVDPAILFILTQHRKVHKQLISTAQSFMDITAQFRRFCNEIIEVKNVGGRWFFQQAFLREDYKKVANKLMVASPGDYDRFVAKKIRWKYDFIATDELFNKYNTYGIVDCMINTKMGKDEAIKHAHTQQLLAQLQSELA